MQTKTYLPVWREKFTVRSYDIGLNARMRISSICSYFQEIANKHATHLDAGYHFMHETGRVWVLSKLFMTIHKTPAWGTEFFAETWPLGLERIFFRRDYRMDDGENTLVTATSWWILLDLNTRRPTVFHLNEEVLNQNQGRHSMVMPADGFSGVESESFKLRQAVFSDLDQNRHVNNARYAEWIFDVLDEDVLDQKPPVSFAIEYKHEVKAGDSVELRTQRNDTDGIIYDVEGKLAGTGQVCVRARVGF
ncbi:MAG TPA: acyl-ACP thioesterase domain-containing protein [Bacteroidales bacterium]|nr:acyl-ACP thioesterase domain-containing protein [Bacteroidales bacterium]